MIQSENQRQQFPNRIDLNPCLRMKLDAAGFLATCDSASDRCIGITEPKFQPSTKTPAVVLMPERGDVVTLTAAGAIAAAANVGHATGGKIAANVTPRVGVALEAASANGDQIRVLYDAADGPETPIALTDAATVAVNAGLGRNFKLTFTAAVGNTRAIANPTNLIDGVFIMLICDQDSVGGRSINSWGSKYRFSGGVTPTFTATASKRDILLFRYDAIADKLDHLATQTNL